MNTDLRIDEHRPGDKVRIRFGIWAGERGIVVSASASEITVNMHSGRTASVLSDSITNYSRAARRAWEKIPKKAGRPRLLVPRKRMVSMRIDVDLWEQLGMAADRGLVKNKQQAVNQWLRERLAAVLGTVILEDTVDATEEDTNRSTQ